MPGQMGQQSMQDKDIEALAAAIAALEGQRGALGDALVEATTAPLRARLAEVQRGASLQRRQVTVLFADVVGSTAMASSLDAEDTLDLLSPTLQRMAALVQAHQGRVLRFTGDGVKAAFGMDEAREDDADRAVRAGLAILQAGLEQAEVARRAHGIADFAVRVGVHTGDVALGVGVESDNTAMGAAVNVAARMEQSAPPGALRISHDTFSLVRGLFEVEPQPPLLVKGLTAPMQTYLVRAALDRRVAHIERGLQGLNTALVGREAELQSLRDAVARARQTRQLQAVSLLGEAGLGKSRLLRELITGLSTGHAADARACRVLTVRSQPDGELRPWGLLRSLLALQFGVADTDSAEAARQKVEAGLSPCFAERGPQQAQLIGQLAGLDFADSPHLRGLGPRLLRDQAFAAFCAYLQSLAAGGAAPPLLVVEDLHWADDGSLDLLQHLLAHAAELPLALVMTGRPALLLRRPDWGPPGTLLTLAPLAAAHSDALLQALLQGLHSVPAPLSELIIGQAEGNPYYMEELVRRLVDDGVIEVGAPHWRVHLERLQNVRLPGTLVGLLQARLDALPAEQRRAARQASVIGHVFWDDALLALDPNAPQALPALQRAAFVRLHQSSDFEGTAERQFDHHLLHQVTYDTLLKTERRLGHSAAARWLSERTQGRGAEFLAMTAEHAERAGDTALAISCFEQAGLQARARFANAAAQSCFTRALALLGDTEPLRRFDLLDELAKIADTVGDRASQESAHVEMAALLARHPDDARQAELGFSKALLADRRSDAAASEQLANQAFEVAERCGAAQWAAMAQGQLAWLHIARQDYPGAVRHLAIGLPWAGRIVAEHIRAETESQLLTLSGMVSLLTSRLDEARATLRAVLSRGEALGRPRLQLGALDNLARVAAYQGRWDESTAWGERGRALAEAIGARHDVAVAQLRLAEAAEPAGDTAAAMQWHEQCLPTFRAQGDRRHEAGVLRQLGSLHLDAGDAQTALQHMAQALELHQGLDEPLAHALLVADMALCQTRLGRSDAARLAVDGLLARLSGDLAPRPAHETLAVRWRCQQVLAALGDARAAALLQQLQADVQARALELTDAADRDRLIQARPDFRAIVSAASSSAIPPAGFSPGRAPA
jgi:class 3 adenylate cyclase/tetratricopeptide (TPR) repeat protein